MPDAQELQSVLDAAERAASGGDYASAERLLREAAAQQESTFGPFHPDLANTFNNLGIVCELTEKPEDAEGFFRKSYAIATASLDPDHPFVATSRKNLEDFCVARGRPVGLPVVAKQEIDEEPELPRPVVVPRPAPDPTVVQESAPVAQPPAVPVQHLLAVGVGVLIGVVLLALLVGWLRGRGVMPVASAPGATDLAPGTTPAQPPPAPPPSLPPPPAATTTDRSASTPGAAAPRTKVPRSSGPQPDVATAQLCTALATTSSWHCAAAGDTVAPGTIYFYTRIKSPAATTVQHRWYRDDRLRQSVELSVSPNTNEGYRTYSRTTVSGGGQWRVELRTRDGVVLREERFTVR